MVSSPPDSLVLAFPAGTGSVEGVDVDMEVVLDEEVVEVEVAVMEVDVTPFPSPRLRCLGPAFFRGFFSA